MNNKRKGISLIVLVITIIVMIILASAIILALSGSGVIGKSNKAKFQNDIATMREELSVYISNKEAETNGAYNHELLNANKDSLVEEGITVEGKTILDIITSMDKKYIDKIEIVNGKLKYIGSNVNEIKWSDEILEGIKGNNLEEAKIEQSSAIKLQDSASMSLSNCRIYGNSIQNGTPSTNTPVLVESVGESTANLVKDAREVFKNFADYTELEEDGRQCIRIKSNGGAYAIFDFTFKENTQYTISFDFKCKYDRSGVSLSYDVPFAIYYTDGNVDYCSLQPINDTWNKRVLTTKAGKTVSYIKAIGFEYRVYDYIDVNTFQIQEGAIATDYEPYGKYKIPIVQKGKNLAAAYDVCKKFDYYTEVIEDGKNCIRYLDSNTTKANPFGFKENTQYTVSFDCKLEKGQWGNDTTTPTSYTMVFHYTDGTFGSVSTRDGIAMGVRGVWQTKTMTSQAGKTVAGIGTRSYQYENYNYIDVNTFQIEEGATATEYEPYIEPVTTNIYLDEPLRKVGNYADYIDFRSQEVVRNVEVVDDTGTLPLEQSLRGLDTPVREKITIPSVILNEGTNIIEVLTKVQPSKIETLYYKK